MNEYLEILSELDEEMKGCIEGLNELLQVEMTEERNFSVYMILEYFTQRRELVHDIQKALVKAEWQIEPYLEEFRFSDEAYVKIKKNLQAKIEKAVKLLEYNATKCMIYLKKYEEFSLET